MGFRQYAPQGCFKQCARHILCRQAVGRPAGTCNRDKATPLLTQVMLLAGHAYRLGVHPLISVFLKTPLQGSPCPCPQGRGAPAGQLPR